MADKLLLCCRLPGAGMPSRGRGYLERARSILVRAEARGGTLVAWGNARLYFALDESAIDDLIALATKPGEEGRVGEERFAFGVAQGPIESLEPDGSRGELAWGHALVAAGALAMAARPGQVLLADRVKAVRSGDLVLRGGRFVEEAGLRLRGLVLDVRQPWKRDAIASLGRLVEPPLLAAEGDGALVVKPGGYALLCAPRGLGGTRRLNGLATRYGDRAFVVRPSGSALEPLGALRRAMARAVAKELPPSLAPHASALESLLSSEPIALDVAHDVVSAYLAPRGPGQAPGVLFVDDAERLDPESLEVLGAAMRGPTPFPAVLRVLSGADAPKAFAKGPPSATVTLQKLGDDLAETLASAFTGGALDVEGKRRWARLGDGVPLGILEAITHGLHSTELAWIGDQAFPRRKVSGRGKPRPAAHFVTLRAHQCPPASRAFLAAVALLGGEARVEHVGRMLAAADQPVVAESAAQELVRSRWLTVPEPGWVALPTRTHVESLSNILEPPLLLALQRAAVDVLEGEGGFAKLEAVHHALAAGDADRARRIVSTAVLGLAQAKLTDAVSRLRLLVNLPEREARETTDERTHPGMVSKTGITPPMANAAAVQAALAPKEASPPPPRPPVPEPDEAPESEPTFVLTKPTGGTPAAGMAAVSVARPTSTANPASDAKPSTQQNPQANAAEKSVPVPADSEPPTIADMAPVLTNLTQLQRTLGAASDRPAKVAATKPVLSLAEQIKAAIMNTNHDELERLLSAGQESSGEAFAERVRALSRLKRGEIGDALRVLRRVRHAPDASPSARCQTALSLGIAYAASSRFEESLLEGLTALARAREGGDPRGIHASLAFLARLYQGMGRIEEAKQLREAAADITIST